jgi:hypothetical protein
LSNLEDSIILGCINKHATIYPSHAEYQASRKKSKAKDNPDILAKYVCFMGVQPGPGYFFEMEWKNIYRHADTDFDGIKNYITQQTELRKKIKRKRNVKEKKEVVKNSCSR